MNSSPLLNLQNLFEYVFLEHRVSQTVNSSPLLSLQNLFEDVFLELRVVKL